MNLSALFINKPIDPTLIYVGVDLAGILVFKPTASFTTG